MAFWEAIVLIVLIGAAAKVLLAIFHHGDERAAHDDAEVLHAREEVRALKERIQVLERVITDNHGSRELGQEIERLRDR